MKLFECIIDDENNIFKTLVAVKNKKELLSVYGGNGEFVRIKDVTNEYLTEKSIELLNDNLTRMSWGEAERKILCALLEEHIKGLKR